MDRLWTAFVQQFPEERAISLASALEVVCILGYGALGETLRQFIQTLNLQSQNQFLSVLAEVKRALTGPDVKTANLFVFDQKQSLLNTQFYNAISPFATMTAMNLQDPATVEQINKWIAENTGFLNMFTSGDLRGDLFIANALWFSDAWNSPFKQSDTHDQPFTRLDGSRVTVPMMFKEGHLETSGDRAVRLQLRGGAVAEFVLGLDPKQNIPQLEYKSEDVMIYLPRFSVEMTVNLSQILIAAGLTDILKPGYQRILQSEAPLEIGTMKQRVYVRFDEAGAEVKALTYVALAVKLGPTMGPQKKVIRFDRPFHFRITRGGQSIVEGFYNGGGGQPLLEGSSPHFALEAPSPPESPRGTLPPAFTLPSLSGPTQPSGLTGGLPTLPVLTGGTISPTQSTFPGLPVGTPSPIQSTLPEGMTSPIQSMLPQLPTL